MIIIKDTIENHDVKRNIRNSVNSFSKYQKLEAQFQGILFSELLNKNQLPLLECKFKNNTDIFVDNTLIELKYQFEFDLQNILKFYDFGTNKEFAQSIEKDIEESSIFIMFILERSDSYLANECIFQNGGLSFQKSTLKGDLFKKYSLELKRKYSKSKDIEFIERYIENDNQWKLHLIIASSI